MNLKEKIKKSFKPCKRLKLLEYNEFLEKEELNDTPTSRAMYCEYKSQVDEKNNKADIILSKKLGGLLFAVILTAVIICLFVNQVSATVYYGWGVYDLDTPVSPTDFMFSEYLPGDTTSSYTMYQNYACYSIHDYEYYITFYPITLITLDYSSQKSVFACNDVEQFQRFLAYNNLTTYSSFVSWLDSYDSSINSGNIQPPLCDYFITETTFNEMKNFVKYTTNDLSNAYKQGVTDSIDMIDETLTNMGIYFEPYVNDGRLSTINSMLNDNVGMALTMVRQDGYNSGLAHGKQNFIASQEYRDLLANEYQKGFNKGEETAPLVESSLRSFFNAPINFISNILNFEIFGINLWAVFTFILTLGLVFFIIKKVVGL